MFQHKFNLKAPVFWCKNSVTFLAIFWFIGLVVGSYFAFAAQGIFSSLMRTAVSSRVSIVYLAMLLFFPLFLSAAAAYFHIPAAILPVVFLKGCSYGLIAGSAVLTFQSAGWLMYYLLVFSDTCMLPPLFWFWIRHINGNGICLKRDFTVCWAVGSVLCLLDYLFVSPFLVALVNS